MIEREIKLLFATPGAARSAVRACGVVPLHARRLQDDALYDTTEGMLRERGCILRVRTERWSDATTTTLTIKGPVHAGPMKMREEHETLVERGAALLHGLELLGLVPWFRYQKYREEFSSADLTIAIDETPVGTYVELEGHEDAILRATAALGRSPQDFILDSYYRLFQKRRDEFGLHGAHMLFGER